MTNTREDADRKKGNVGQQQKTRKMSYADRDRLKILLENISTIVENCRLMAGARNNDTIGAEKEKSATGIIECADYAKIGVISCTERQ